MITITIDQIKSNVSTNPKWAERAIVALYDCQTDDEQMSQVTQHLNGIGFNGVDAEILSSFAEWILAGRHLTSKQLAIAYKKLPKYAGQLARIAEARNQGQPVAA